MKESNPRRERFELVERSTVVKGKAEVSFRARDRIKRARYLGFIALFSIIIIFALTIAAWPTISRFLSASEEYNRDVSDMDAESFSVVLERIFKAVSGNKNGG